MSSPLKVYRATLIFLLISIFYSFDLWFDFDRFIPLIPLFDIPPIRFLNIFFTVSLISSIIYNIFFLNRYVLCLSILSIIALCIFDRLKWQPWLYLYFVVFILFIFQHSNKQFTLLIAVKYLIAITYLWAGLHKLSEQYLVSISYLFPYNFEEVKPFFYWFPYIEILLSFLFFIFINNKFMNLIGVLFHFSISIFILYTNNNFIIIIWNLYFISIYLIHYFSYNPFLIYLPNWKIHTVILLFMCLPILSYFNKFDRYLSFSLYSGKNPELFLVFKPAELSQEDYSCFRKAIIPNDIAKTFLNTKENAVVVSYHKLCLNNLKVPLVAEDDVLSYLKIYYSGRYPESEFYIYKNSSNAFVKK